MVQPSLPVITRYNGNVSVHANFPFGTLTDTVINASCRLSILNLVIKFAYVCVNV
jgi:hypothetical protein